MGAGVGIALGTALGEYDGAALGAPVVGIADGGGLGTPVVGTGLGSSVRFLQYASQSNPVGICEAVGVAVVGWGYGATVEVDGAGVLGAGVLGAGVGCTVGVWVVVCPNITETDPMPRRRRRESRSRDDSSSPSRLIPAASAAA